MATIATVAGCISIISIIISAYFLGKTSVYLEELKKNKKKIDANWIKIEENLRKIDGFNGDYVD